MAKQERRGISIPLSEKTWRLICKALELYTEEDMDSREQSRAIRAVKYIRDRLKEQE